MHGFIIFYQCKLLYNFYRKKVIFFILQFIAVPSSLQTWRRCETFLGMFKFWKKKNLQAWDLRIYWYDGIRNLQINWLRFTDNMISVCLCVSPLATVVFLVNSCVSKHVLSKDAQNIYIYFPDTIYFPSSCEQSSFPTISTFFLKEQAGRAAPIPTAAAGYSFSLSMTETFPSCSLPIKTEILAQGMASFMMQSRPQVCRDPISELPIEYWQLP